MPASLIPKVEQAQEFALFGYEVVDLHRLHIKEPNNLVLLLERQKREWKLFQPLPSEGCSDSVLTEVIEDSPKVEVHEIPVCVTWKNLLGRLNYDVCGTYESFVVGQADTARRDVLEVNELEHKLTRLQQLVGIK
ncbi:hypothetical protein HMPREF3086_10490 [Dietzia sp. HMSC21D01]|nr:hypothetical protein HMPREF3086_10490 [Dietzia sp. HMSC21D01]